MIVIDTEEMKDYFFVKLLAAGLAPAESDTEVIADIFFDYLIDKGIVQGWEDYDEHE